LQDGAIVFVEDLNISDFTDFGGLVNRSVYEVELKPQGFTCEIYGLIDMGVNFFCSEVRAVAVEFFCQGWANSLLCRTHKMINTLKREVF
jgi:hypothetical protein